jgi:tetratricopeptide (TPR) repeat protein
VQLVLCTAMILAICCGHDTFLSLTLLHSYASYTEIYKPALNTLSTEMILNICRYLHSLYDYFNFHNAPHGPAEQGTLESNECPTLHPQWLPEYTCEFEEAEVRIYNYLAIYPIATALLFEAIHGQYPHIWERILAGNILEDVLELEKQLVAVHMEKGRLDNAVGIWEAIWAECPSSSIEIGLRLAAVHKEKGRLDDAIKIWEAIWTLYCCHLGEQQYVTARENNRRMDFSVEVWKPDWFRYRIDFIDAGEELAAVYVETGRLDDAVGIWEAIRAEH